MIKQEVTKELQVENKSNEPATTISTDHNTEEQEKESSTLPAQLAATKLVGALAISDCSVFTTSKHVKYLFTGVWIFILTIIFLANVVHLSLLTAQFYEHNTKVNVYFADDPPTFPSFVICNCNPFNLLFENDGNFTRANVPQDVFESYDVSFVRSNVGVPLEDIEAYADDEKIPVHERDIFMDNRFFNCYTITHQFSRSVDVQKLSIFMSI